MAAPVPVKLLSRTISASTLLTLVALLMTTIPTFSTTLFIDYIAENTTYEQTSNAQRTVAINVATNFDNDVTQYEDALQAVTMVSDFANADLATKSTLMQTLRMTGVTYFEIFDTDGKGLVRSDGGSDPDTLPLTALAGVVHNQPTMTVQNQNVIFISPILDDGDNLSGYLGAIIPADSVKTILLQESVSQRTTTDIWVLDRNGSVIIGDPDPPLGSSASSGSTRIAENDGIHILAYAPIADTNWTALIDNHAVVLQMSLDTIHRTAVALLTITTLAALVAGIALSRIITHPLRQLVSATHGVIAEDPFVPIPSSFVTEIEVLSRTFEEMRSKLAIRARDKEQALLLAQRAASMREEFLSVAAHELKTPITSLQGYTQLAIMRLDQNNTEDMHDKLDRIQIQTKRLTVLIDTLLDVSRIERGQLELEKKPLDIVTVVRDLIDINWPGLDRIQLKTPARQVMVYGDSLRLGQVVTNLVSNSLKFSPQATVIEITITALLNSVQLTVRDHGPGIPDSIRPHIFERFIQGHAETYQSGLGLGLFITKQIVELHNGSISVKYPEDGGTSVTVMLPRRGMV